MSNTISRRGFFNRTALYGGTAFVALNFPRALQAAKESSTRTVLSKSEWATVEAITGRIIPTDHEPGAIEAGCVNFIDKALANEDQSLRPEYAAGLTALDAVSRKRFRKPFVKLDAEQQDDVLAALESGNAEALAAAFARLLDDAGLRARLGENGRQLVEERFDIHRNIGRLVELLAG